MNYYQMWVSFYTIVRKDIVRIFRIWPQTFLPSIITSILYFLVFGKVLGGRIGEIGGHPYITFVVPGLVMLAVVTNSFSNVATTFFQAKFFARNIDEILVSPTPAWVIIAGYVAGGMVRGITIGLLVIVVSAFFSPLPFTHPLIILLFLILSSLLFSLAGLVNGIYAKSFDGITIVPTFVLTPLVYLGGVFYSAQALPPLWQKLTFADPIFYLINGFRAGFMGFSDISLSLSIGVLAVLIAILVGINWYFIRTGLGLRQ
ncbi:ABC transporter permease [Candidatus Kaiserbacteria bacterium RIFCSPHIGHO2_12_FULL_53_13]|uniref:Transport permease protein n=1 Tax=Candidatus Kaiserbacteria bacterium RIFCSPHIGHO2_12_FULL_53_13 TaxID=1798502 RepID=A0A1F6EBX7_9BACT|nr:MAG: ABC transporter permease [Candidatus Kaiserbacteria bacterium RIFCSPHIGHO2_12_FULL_53_13]OGG74723.1 MAG: ABC transporter permease [Candidatus Kaiserbacteria bacterium RIFCSPLOWO2_01_FULL_52_36]